MLNTSQRLNVTAVATRSRGLMKDLRSREKQVDHLLYRMRDPSHLFHLCVSVRFSVRDADGKRSAVWGLFGMGGGNVGIAFVEAAGMMKISLHESGRWQVGYTSEYERQQRAAGKWDRQTRHWERWTRPREKTPGYTEAIQIIVPRFSLAPRNPLKKEGQVRWLEVSDGKAVMFTIWIAKSSVPPWQFGDEFSSDIVATLALENGEFVIVGSHEIDHEAATRSMLLGLGGFVRTLMAMDTSRLDPLPMHSTLIGFSASPDGALVLTEMALWGLRSATLTTGSGAAAGDPQLGEFSQDLSAGSLEAEVVIPRSVFKERGVDPDADPNAARLIADEWNQHKQAELRRLFGFSGSVTEATNYSAEEDRGPT